jgi:hypothetical protein
LYFVLTVPAYAGWPYAFRPATPSPDAYRPVLVLALPSIDAYPPSFVAVRSREADWPHAFVAVELRSMLPSWVLMSLLTLFVAPLCVVAVLLTL